MRAKQPPVMAIHATARGFGYVVMTGPFSLFDWGTIAVRKHKNATCLARLDILLTRYQPHTLVIEDPERSPSRSGRIVDLYKALVPLCQTHGIDLAIFSRAEMAACYATIGAKGWHDIAEAVARQLAPLRPLVPPRRKAWQSEIRRMAIFAAAALAMTYWQLADTSRIDLG